MTAETVVGSIVGYLRLNDDDWRRTIDRAKADLKALDSQRVNVDVKVDTAVAKAKLEELAALAETLDAEKVDVKVSTDKVQRAKKDVNLLGTAIAALAPATIPVGVAAVGLGTAFAGMGATAALAVYGIKREMTSGTAAGQAYSQVIAGLKGDLDGLGHTAAVGSLGAVQQVFAVLHQQMPGLNREVAGLASITGSAVVPAVHGLVTGLQAANPLFLAGGVAIRGMAEDFDRFAQSQGFKDFVSYAAANLPRVLDDVEELAQAAIRLGAAFAPMGMGTLSALRMVAQLLNSLPIGVLQELASGATSAYVAFQTWKGLSNILSGVTTALDGVARRSGSSAAAMLANAAASGAASLAVGGLAAGVGIAAMAWANYEQRQAEAKQQTQMLTQAIVEDNGAIGENAKAQAVQQLSATGALSTLQKYGVTIDQITESMRTGTPVTAQMTNEQNKAALAAAQLVDSLHDSDLGFKLFGIGGKSATGQLKDLETQTKLAKEAAAQQTEAMFRGSRAADDAQQADYNLKVAKIDVTTATDDQRKAVDQLNQALDREISRNVTLAGGQLAVAQAEADLIARLKVHTSSVSLNTQEGRDNQQQIISTVTALQQLRDSQSTNAASTLEATRQYQLNAQALLDQIAKTDGASSATYNFAKYLLGIPSEVKTKIGLDNRDALAGIAAVQTQLGIIAATNAVATVSVAVNAPRLASVEAQLGRIRGFDRGGFTGSGGRFEPAGIVHKGEVVFSQEDVAAHGGAATVEAFRKARVRGYASGGIVGAATDYDISDIFSLVTSMAVDPDKLSSAKSATTSANKGVGGARSALSKVLIDLAAAQRKLELARHTKSKSDDITALARVNKLLQERTDKTQALTAAIAKAGAAQSSYNTLLAASKMSPGQLFVKATGQNNAVNQTFLNDLMKIRSRGFGPLALQLLNQGDEEAMKVAHSLANGPLAQLVAANANLQKSGQLQGKLDALKSDLNGTNVSAARDAAKQQMSLDYQAALARYGTTSIKHDGGGVTATDVEQIVSRVVQRIPNRDIYMDSGKVGREVERTVTQVQDNRAAAGRVGIYAGQG